MFPCLYLSQRYSAHFTAEFFKPALQQALYQEVFKSWFRGEVCKVDGIALASSCLLIKREWFLAMGGMTRCRICLTVHFCCTSGTQGH